MCISPFPRLLHKVNNFIFIEPSHHNTVHLSYTALHCTAL